ncbi:orotidine-5'-phosphate decarboxylase [Arthrobacter sp. ATA002]|uniref:orotidine-5'-phosphate decarboxylase n=1 Tax=Arthrobacter sp. ATA002 TaxID=2991715 RepID=UPI0022A689F4|nr:orotidine-5'-phosphate decarboxylase [Arthrobacter sp. ATA002]WAP53349.1 orotidine-5'-phosphate decarboxylase [Arthrobacter sp. ATA002]
MPEHGAGTGPVRAPFGQRLRRTMDARGQLCVGIDPHPALLAAWGLNDDAEALERFSLTVLEAVGEQAAAVKPQVALFERHGSAGLAALERVLAACADAELLSIADAKRGDIGSTMAAYADAWLKDGSALAADSVTLSPYLGFESLRPALDLAAASGRGVFVLALTSNPEGASVQHAGGDRSVAARIVEAAAAENSRELGRAAAAGPGAASGYGGLGSTGLVVGATVGSALAGLGINLAAAHTPVLAPGLGAQGATGADLRSTFGPAYPNVLATSSRDILRAGPEPAALRDAARRTLEELGTS